METYIITGASKGIGLALSGVLARKGHQVLGIARTFQGGWPGNKPFEFDLLNTDEIPALIKRIFSEIPADTKKVVLINNAGTVAPIGFAGKNRAEDINRSVTLNLTAPMVTTAAFIQETANISIEKAIINISSGAGRNAYEGWSAYCAGKAGLDHFSSVVEKEYEDIKVISVAPGIIDTDMQAQIRSSSDTDFPLLANFKDYKAKGRLSTPDETAEKLVQLMERTDFRELNTIADIRDFD